MELRYNHWIGEPGVTFAGTDRYRLLGEVGSGAMGVVYAARDEERGETVALKVLRRLDGLAIYRFKHEFRALADVVHPNLVSLYELQLTRDHWFFTMELIDGADFLTYVRTGETARKNLGRRVAELPTPTVTMAGTLDTMAIPTDTFGSTGIHRSAGGRRAPVAPLADAEQFQRLRHVLSQLGAGIQALHGVGTLHRDIKPSNVLVDGSGHLRLLDFGVVTELAGRTSMDGDARLIGTPAYMAPELGTDHPLTEASDWYAVGVMLYQALTGRRPFTGSVQEILQRKRSEDPPAPNAIADAVPADLNALCVELLARDPARRPSGRQLANRLGMTRETAVVVPATRAGKLLVGRQRHLDELRKGLARATAGAPVAMFVHGPSGMGKSALVDQFCTEAVSTAGAAVLSGRCYERESVPYKALDDLMDDLADTLLDMSHEEAAALVPRDFLVLARAFPVLRRLSALDPGANVELRDPHEQRRVAVRAFRELLRRLARRAPLILHIDDLQWGDSDSAALLADVLRQPNAPPVMFIASYRSDEAETGGFVARLAEALDEHTEVEVERLPPADARSLARTLLDGAGLDDQHADAIAHEARGNPFFVAELVQYVAESVARNQDGLALSLEEVIAARLAKLPDDARALLDVLAVAGRPIAQVVALRAAGIRGKEQHAVSLLRLANLARTRGVRALDAIETYHDRIRETTYSMLGEKTRRELHLSVARAMQATDIGDAEGLGAHFELGGRPALAGPYYVAAAEAAAQQLAFDRTGALYVHAVELLQPEPAERSDLFARAADAYANAGKGREAAWAYEHAAEGAATALALRYRGRACEELLRSGHVSEGQAAMREVLGEVGIKLPRSQRGALLRIGLLRARIRLRGLGYRERDETQITLEQLTRIDVCWAAGLALGMSDHMLGTMLQAHHLLGALRTGARDHVTRALAMESVFSSLGGIKSRRRTSRISEHTLELAAKLGDPLTLVWANGSAAFARYQIGDWTAARDYAEQSLQHARGKPGMWWERCSVSLYRVWTLYWLGKFAAMTESVPELLRDAATRGDLYSYTNFCNGFPAISWLVRDTPETWLPIAEEAMSRWSRDAYHLQHYWHMMARCQYLLYRGEPGPALQLIDEEWPMVKRARLLDVQMVTIEARFLRGRCALAVAATDTDDRESLLTRVRRDARSLRRTRAVHARALATMLTAGIANVRGDLDQAKADLQQAEQGCTDVAMATNAAICRRQLGRLIGGDEGAALTARAEAQLKAEAIVNLPRFAQLFLPGFDGD